MSTAQQSEIPILATSVVRREGSGEAYIDISFVPQEGLPQQQLRPHALVFQNYFTASISIQQPNPANSSSYKTLYDLIYIDHISTRPTIIALPSNISGCAIESSCRAHTLKGMHMILTSLNSQNSPISHKVNQFGSYFTSHPQLGESLS